MLFDRFRNLGASYHQVKRLRHIVAVLLKYGYGDLARHLPLPRAARIPFQRVRRQQEEMQHVSQPERLRRACEELGPTFVKLGQLAAARTRVFPQEFTDELARLQDEVTPLPFAQIRAVLETELKRPLAEVFSSVEEQPLGSASVAQVHRARLLTGQEVVVKVQRPGIQLTVRDDLAILRRLALLAETHLPEWRARRPVALVDELGRTLERELDFTCEAGHLERFAWQFREEPAIYLPALYRSFTTPRVLVMEYVHGIKASKLDEIKAAGMDSRELGRRIADLMMKQIFTHGFFHADPHPGNVRIMADQRISFLDFGMMGHLDPGTRMSFVDLVWGIVRRDESAVAAALLKLTRNEAEPAPALFESDVAEFMHQHFYRPAGEIQVARLMSDLVQLTGEHQLYLPPDLVLMLKALSETEDLVRLLDPKLDLVAQAAPFMKQTRLDRFRPGRMMSSLLEFGQELAEAAQEMPRELRRVIRQIQTGQTRLNFRHEGLEPLTNAMERSTNRLSFALVAASLVISSSLIIHSQVPPLWRGVSMVGLVGYVLAGLMGFWLLIAILRHGKM
jgi:ubiquinone biosynthesis protein